MVWLCLAYISARASGVGLAGEWGREELQRTSEGRGGHVWCGHEGLRVAYGFIFALGLEFLDGSGHGRSKE